jgi:RND family efflux transporter MFP subunit
MKKHWKKIVFIIAGLALFAITARTLLKNKEVTSSRVYQYDRTSPIHVFTDTVKITDIGTQKLYTGTFEPWRETKVSAETQGKINQIYVETGDAVIAGQTLLQQDVALLQHQLQSIEIQIQGLEQDIARYTILTEADAIQGVQLEKAQLGLKSAQTQKATLLAQISKAVIRAPFQGVITAKLNEIGGFAAPGVPLLQITELHRLKFTMQVHEKDLHQFTTGNTYNIIADAWPEMEFTGTVTMTGSKASAANTYPVQLEVKNTKDLKIKAGMFGKMQLNSSKPMQGIQIPSTAVTGSAEQPRVYKVQNGIAHLHDITIETRTGNNVIVSKGLTAGDIIVTRGFIQLFDGAHVAQK